MPLEVMPHPKPSPATDTPGRRPPDGYVPSESGAGEEDPGASMDVVKEQGGVGEEATAAQSGRERGPAPAPSVDRLNKG